MRDAIVLCHVSRNGIGHDNGDRVVRGGDIHGADQQAHAELSSLSAAKGAVDPAKQRVKSAVDPDQGADGRDEDRNHCGLKHPGGTGAHAAQKRGRRHGTRNQHDHSPGQNADQQHNKDIDADYPADQNQNVGDGLDQIIGLERDFSHAAAQRQNQNQDQRQQGCRQRDGKVFTELVLHVTALSVAGGDGCVRDEGQVVPEHGAADDRCDTERQIEARCLRHRDGNRTDQRDRADRGTHRERDKAADREQHNHGIPGRDHGEREISHALSTAAAYHTDENTCLHEDEDHRHDVPVADSLAHDTEFFIKRKRPVLQTGGQQRNQENDHDRDVIETHRDFQNVLKQDTQTEIQNQKDTDGKKRSGVSFFHKNNPPTL